MRFFLFLAALAGMSMQVAGAEDRKLSAKDLIAKSEAAYAALQSYVGTTTVKATTVVGATTLDQVSTAKVSFRRPGKIRIEGTTSSGPMGRPGHPFAVVSDGTKMWKSWAIVNNGAFGEIQDLAMSGLGGVAQGAAECIPTALMKSDGARAGGHDPFLVPRLSSAVVEGQEKIDGVDCHKVVAKHPDLGDVTLWIDGETFLLRQMARETNEAQMAKMSQKADEALKKFGKERPQGVGQVKSSKRVFSFTTDAINEPVEEKLFANPTN